MRRRGVLCFCMILTGETSSSAFFRRIGKWAVIAVAAWIGSCCFWVVLSCSAFSLSSLGDFSSGSYTPGLGADKHILYLTIRPTVPTVTK
jgi:hypothetical protein